MQLSQVAQTVLSQAMQAAQTVSPALIVQAAQAAQSLLLTGSSDGGFRIAVVGDAARPAGGGEALVAVRPVAEVAPSDGNISFTLPSDTFAHTSGEAMVQLSAKQADGNALPSWLTFNSETGTISGQPPAGITGEMVVRVIARDQDGREAIAVIRVNVKGGATQQPGEGQPQGKDQPQGNGIPKDDGKPKGDVKPKENGKPKIETRPEEKKGTRGQRYGMEDHPADEPVLSGDASPIRLGELGTSQAGGKPAFTRELHMVGRQSVFARQAALAARQAVRYS
ncbi:MAG: putative Ig domain-containing protein [Rhodospirillales bacterium]|nr:putative Ig domain-containing protein [Rhodospirillales bacterium]